MRSCSPIPKGLVHPPRFDLQDRQSSQDMPLHVWNFISIFGHFFFSKAAVH